MMNDDDDNVTPFPKRKREPSASSEAVLHIVHRHESGCNHISTIVPGTGLGGRIVHAQYHLREGETEVACSLCHARLDPMWVLLQLSNRESRMVQRVADHREELIALQARLAEQSKVKCDHCGKFTNINRRRRR